MNLPKYIPGLTVVVKEAERQSEFEERTYPEDIGMFVISSAFLEHEEWHYENYDGKIQFHESEIIGVINNGYYVAADRFNGVVEAPEQNPQVMSEEEFEEMTKPDADEEAFIKAEFEKHQAELKEEKKPKKIEVKDGNETPEQE